MAQLSTEQLPVKQIIIKTFNELFADGQKDFDKLIKNVLIEANTSDDGSVVDYVNEEKMFTNYKQIFGAMKRQYGKRFLRWEDEEFIDYLLNYIDAQLPNLYAKQMLLVDNELTKLKGKNGIVNKVTTKGKGGTSSNPADEVIGTGEELELEGKGVDQYNLNKGESEQELGIWNQAKLMASSAIKNELYAFIGGMNELFITKQNEEFLRKTYTPILRFETYEEVTTRVLTAMGFDKGAIDAVKLIIGDFTQDDPNEIFGDPRRSLIRQIVLIAEGLAATEGKVTPLEELVHDHVGKIASLENDKADKTEVKEVEDKLVELNNEANRLINLLNLGKADKTTTIALQASIDAIINLLQKRQVTFTGNGIPIVFTGDTGTATFPVGTDLSGFVVGDNVAFRVVDTVENTEEENTDRWNNGQATPQKFFSDNQVEISTSTTGITFTGVATQERSNKFVKWLINTSSATVDVSSKANLDLGNVNVGLSNAGKFLQVKEDGTIEFYDYLADKKAREDKDTAQDNRIGSLVCFWKDILQFSVVKQSGKWLDTTLFSETQVFEGEAILGLGGAAFGTSTNGEVISHTHTQAGHKHGVDYKDSGAMSGSAFPEYKTTGVSSNSLVARDNYHGDRISGTSTETPTIDAFGNANGNFAKGKKVVGYLYRPLKNITYAEMGL